MKCKQCNEEMVEINGAIKCLFCGKEEKGVVDTTKKQQLGGITGKGFMPGVSGNPAGRPKGTFSLKEIMRRKLQEMSPDQRRTAAEMFIENLIQDGLDGQDKARDLIMTYLESKPATDLNINQTSGLQSKDFLIPDENE